jgi:hypothetical protein
VALAGAPYWASANAENPRATTAATTNPVIVLNRTNRQVIAFSSL